MLDASQSVQLRGHRPANDFLNIVVAFPSLTYKQNAYFIHTICELNCHTLLEQMNWSSSFNDFSHASSGIDCSKGKHANRSSESGTLWLSGEFTKFTLIVLRSR